MQPSIILSLLSAMALVPATEPAAAADAPATAPASDRAAIISRAKKATVIIEPDSLSLGTAFCIDPSGFFITTEAVVHRPNRPNRFKLVLDFGEPNQREVEVRTVRSDPAAGLALLEVFDADKPKLGDLTSLELGDDIKVIETDEVIAAG
ncbi:MAG TPA: serine protease, partial [Gemmataceae bacterium]|nr:serine protease [Gemmataceae bacterium]